MKGLILSAALATGMGVVAAGSASAAPIATRDVIVAPAATSDVGCRVVKSVTYSHGVKRVVTRKACSGPTTVYRSYGYGGYHRPYYRNGVRVYVR